MIQGLEKCAELTVVLGHLIEFLLIKGHFYEHIH